MSSQVVNIEWKSKNFCWKKVTKITVRKIRVSEIRVTEIRVSKIRISSNHRQLHGAIFVGDKTNLIFEIPSFIRGGARQDVNKFYSLLSKIPTIPTNCSIWKTWARLLARILIVSLKMSLNIALLWLLADIRRTTIPTEVLLRGAAWRNGHVHKHSTDKTGRKCTTPEERAKTTFHWSGDWPQAWPAIALPWAQAPPKTPPERKPTWISANWKPANHAPHQSHAKPQLELLLKRTQPQLPMEKQNRKLLHSSKCVHSSNFADLNDTCKHECKWHPRTECIENSVSRQVLRYTRLVR